MSIEFAYPAAGTVQPNNMVYDKSARTYIRGSRFKPPFLKPDANRYLSQLRSVADGITCKEHLNEYLDLPQEQRGDKE